MNRNSDKSPFKAPDNYFEDFKAQMMSRIESTPQYRTSENDGTGDVEPTPTRFQRYKPYLYLAAMFAGMWLMIHGLVYVTDWNQGRKLDQATMASNTEMNINNINSKYYWVNDDFIPSDADQLVAYSDADLDKYFSEVSAESVVVNYLLAYDY